MSCDLCKKEKLTKRYHDEPDDIFWIADCKTCGIPMVVLKRHDMTMNINEMLDMIIIVKKIFGTDARLRLDQRKYKDHWHAHIIPGERPKEIGYHMRVGSMAEA